uniref:Uncharacterized protein n=1 Tax=Arundo donax TaxID=35708 RepID=A0A0A8ZDI3_ARUDO
MLSKFSDITLSSLAHFIRSACVHMNISVCVRKLLHTSC